MSKTMEHHLIRNGAYERILFRRITWDGCVGEQEFGADAAHRIVERFDVAFRANVKRRYIFQGTTLEFRQRAFGGDDMPVLVAHYSEDVSESIAEQEIEK